MMQKKKKKGFYVRVMFLQHVMINKCKKIYIQVSQLFVKKKIPELPVNIIYQHHN